MSEHVGPDVDAISQQGAPGGFELVLASAAFRTISDHIPGHELRTMAAALVQHPGPAFTPVIDLVRQLVPCWAATASARRAIDASPIRRGAPTRCSGGSPSGISHPVKRSSASWPMPRWTGAPRSASSC